MKSFRVLVISFAVALITSFPSHAFSDEPVADLSKGQAGKIVFYSANYETFKDLIEGKRGKQTKIQGDLKLPNTNGKIPAAILLHTLNGLRDKEGFELADTLNDAGFATFFLDSQTPRGVTTGESASRKITYAMTVSDAYAALKLLGTHPKVDRNRIAVVGFSRGGGITLLTTAEKFRAVFIEDDLKFAAHVAFYPGSFLRFHESVKLTRSPVLMLLAGADTITPSQMAVDWAEQLRISGTEVKVKVYEGAGHGFLLTSLSGKMETLNFLKDYTNCRNRYIQIKEDGTLFSPYLNKSLQNIDALIDILNDCRKDKGGTRGDPTNVRVISEKECLNFLKEVFKM
jgi:dienelactone hydrolase